jgi:uncharacterized protein (TIGR02453 family)
MMPQSHITPKLFSFLRDLKNNNRRDWFLENKDRYEEHVREPILQFITEFGIPLREISEHFVADARKVGGSLFRIHRDTRFSKDKTPYKTAVGVQFRHRMGKDAHAPGFYMHLEPGNCFVGAGIWHADNRTLTKIRQAIVNDSVRWKSILKEPPLADEFTQAGESLKRAPKGFDPDHPLIEDLRRKDFIAFKQISEQATKEPSFLIAVAKDFRATSAYVEFLTRAVNLPF